MRFYWLSMIFCLAGCYSTMTDSASSAASSVSGKLQQTQSSLQSTNQVFSSALELFAVLADGNENSSSDLASASRSLQKSQASANELISEIDGLLRLLQSVSSGDYSTLISSLQAAKVELSPTLNTMSTLLRQAINNSPLGTLYQSYQLLEGETQLLSTLLRNAYQAITSAYSYSSLMRESHFEPWFRVETPVTHPA